MTFDKRKKNVETHMKHIHRKRAKAVAVSSGVISLVLVMAVLVGLLFVPYDNTPPSVERYSGSEYYSLIQKLNTATFTPPRYRNPYEKLTSGLLQVNFLPKGEAMNGMDGMTIEPAVTEPQAVPGGAPGAYVEVTDNQVAGVIEADLFKRSGEYLYYLRDCQLHVYSIAQEDSKQISLYSIGREDDFADGDITVPWGFVNQMEMYLSQDGKTVTIVLERFSKEEGTATALINLDVTDPENIVETNRIYLSGAYLSSRMVDGTVLLMSKYRIDPNALDYEDPTTFVPWVSDDGEKTYVECDKIQSPDHLSELTYTVVCAVNASDLTVQDTAAFLSYSEDVYVSNENIYATRNVNVRGEYGGSRATTEISCLRYAGEKMEFLGSVTVDGSIKDQYSMDEYQGILRVVTSINETKTTLNGELVSARIERNASLYCISLEDFSVVAAVERFAPSGEQAESVRFDGEKAYVCTAVKITLTDPVYFFDLSDLENITYTDTGTIDGYSSSLINFGEGYLLGIGYGDQRQLKIEVYAQGEGNVVSVCSFELNAYFSEVYKSYYIDRENNLVGLAVYHEIGYKPEYLLLHFDGYSLNVVGTARWDGDASCVRATVIDGWLYVLSRVFDVEQVW